MVSIPAQAIPLGMLGRYAESCVLRVVRQMSGFVRNIDHFIFPHTSAIISAIGFVPSEDGVYQDQTDSVQQAIRIMFVVVPTICTFSGWWFVSCSLHAIC